MLPDQSMAAIRVLDLSMPLRHGAPNCPVHPPVTLPVTADHPADGWRMEEFHMASHTGTHLDAPLHKISGGMSIDAYPLEAFVGSPLGLDLRGRVSAGTPIDATMLAAACGETSPAGRIVLLDTGWGSKCAKTDEWLYHSPYLAPSGAEWLVAQSARAVGIDHFSIGGMNVEENTRTHEILLGAGLWVVEELRFPEGWLEFAKLAHFQALPLSLPGFSGSPCRAILFHMP
jgi:kynurenine formamidase